MKINADEMKNIIEGSIQTAKDCAARGSERAAALHAETAAIWAKELSLLNIREGRGI